MEADGSRVFYVSDVEGGILSWRAVDGTDEGRVVEAWRAPQSWSPDGKLLTYIETNSDTGRDIGVLFVGDNTFRELFATEFTEDGPAVSANGRFIAFSRQNRIAARFTSARFRMWRRTAGKSRVTEVSFPRGHPTAKSSSS